MKEMSLIQVNIEGDQSELNLPNIREFLRLGFFNGHCTPWEASVKKTTAADLDISDISMRINNRGGVFYNQEYQTKNMVQDPVKTDREFEIRLVKSVESDCPDGHKIYLMASGGKDSISLAWALRELGQPFTLVHCTNNGRENELPDVEKMANRFGSELIVVPDNIELALNVVCDQVKKIVPSGDSATPAYVNALSFISKVEHPNSRVTILDGMGNDVYMGHISPQRERIMKLLPRVGFFDENFVSMLYKNKYLHYGASFIHRAPWERAFSGAGFSVERDSPLDTIVYPAIAAVSGEQAKRALTRGTIFDIDACIYKAQYALQMHSIPGWQVRYPYVDSSLANFFSNLSEVNKFENKRFINKTLLRNFLKKRGVLTEHSTRTKGSFRFDLKPLAAKYTPSKALLELLHEFGIGPGAVRRLHKMSSSCEVSAGKLWILCSLENGIF